MADDIKNAQEQGYPDIADKFAPGETVADEGHGPEYQPGEELPEKYQNILKGLLQKIAMRDQFARIREVERAARLRFAWRGMLNAVYDGKSECWNVPYNGTFFGRNDADTGDIPLSYPLNLIQAFGRGFISIVSEIPAVRMQAKGEAPDAMRIANAADAFRRKIEAQNNMDAFMEDLARLMWTDGQVSSYSRWVCDGARFGYEDEEHVDEESEGLGSGKPPKKKKRQPRGGEVCTPYGVLEVKRPITCRERSEFPYIKLAFEIDTAVAKAMYPLKAKQIKGGEASPGDYQFDRTTRIACMQGIELQVESGDTTSALTTWERTWIRPVMFAEVEDEKDRAFLEDAFPDGVFVTFMGQTYCESRNESMDDHWETCKPIPGDGQATPACGEILMPVNDALNDLMDLQMERSMKSIPAIVCAKGMLNLPALSKSDAQPGMHIETEIALPPNSAMEDHFWAEPQPDTPEGEQALGDALFGSIPQFLTGLYPAATGQGDEHNETLGGIVKLQEAARGQAGVAWRAMRKAYASMMMQLVRIGAYFRAAEAENGMVKIAAPGEAEVDVDLEDLHDGNWWCFPDGDESYPNTQADRKASLMAMIQQADASPMVQAALQVPKNLVYIKKTLGLNEFEIPGEDDEQLQMTEIAQLLKEPPIPDPNGLTMPGFEVPMSPSIPIDDLVDDNAIHFKTWQDWAKSDEGLDAKKNNPEGYLNARLHAMMHKQAMANDQEAQMQQAIKMQAVSEKLKLLSKPSTQPKDPSESIAYKDLGPSGRIQLAARAGLDVRADEGANLAHETVEGTSLSAKPTGQPASKEASSSRPQ